MKMDYARISKYRKLLMGFSILGILFCHYHECRVFLLSWWYKRRSLLRIFMGSSPNRRFRTSWTVVGWAGFELAWSPPLILFTPIITDELFPVQRMVLHALTAQPTCFLWLQKPPPDFLMQLRTSDCPSAVSPLQGIRLFQMTVFSSTSFDRCGEAWQGKNCRRSWPA